MLQQITIIGTGLIGGSFGLAVKKHARVRVVGCDREAVLARARALRAIDDGMADAVAACRGSQVVLLATPVGAIIDHIEKLGPVLPPDVLLTDAGSTKAEIVARAQAVFGDGAARRFLGGHPMAGKEHSGIEHADAGLFAGAVWLLTPPAGQDGREGAAGEFAKLLEAIGARVVEMGLERHDRLCAWVSHLPQMLATALASELLQAAGDDPEAAAVGGRALREMTRIAASPHSMWRDIAITNRDNIEEALLRLEQRLAHIRENLKTAELREEFERGNEFRKRVIHHGDRKT